MGERVENDIEGILGSKAICTSSGGAAAGQDSRVASRTPIHSRGKGWALERPSWNIFHLASQTGAQLCSLSNDHTPLGQQGVKKRQSKRGKSLASAAILYSNEQRSERTQLNNWGWWVRE